MAMAMLPFIFIFPCMNACCAFSFPVEIATRSLSEIVISQSTYKRCLNAAPVDATS